MIKVTVLYPRTPGGRFDFDHYLKVHMPMSIARLGQAMKSIVVERVLSPGPPWPESGFFAICSFVCESREAFEAAFFPHMQELQGDAPNYTDVAQIVLISEVEIDYPKDGARPRA
jgi:uncharacterized protein (TIGR02118 family)